MNYIDKKGSVNKLFSLIITAAVIGMLIFVGPVNALNLKVEGFRDTAYNEGENVNFIASIDVRSDEILDLQNISLVINGETVCTTDVWGTVDYDGTHLPLCDGITIEIINYNVTYGQGYGYGYFEPAGYGYGYGEYNGYGYGYHTGKNNGYIAYNITIDTRHPMFFLSGGNKVKLVVNTPTQQLSSNEGTVLIKPDLEGDGNFLMATETSDMVLYGKYNTSEQTLEGYLYFAGQVDPSYAAAGTYNPTSATSGEIEFRLYDITTVNDAGIIWVGNYSNSRWYLRPEWYSPDIYMEGHMFVPPQ